MVRVQGCSRRLAAARGRFGVGREAPLMMIGDRLRRILSHRLVGLNLNTVFGKKNVACAIFNDRAPDYDARSRPSHDPL